MAKEKTVTAVETPVAPVETDTSGFIVQDPEIARPKELPLIITLPDGQSWKNPEQEEYAKVLNAAAYCFPDNWKINKVAELARLTEIGKDPSRYYVYTGVAKGAPGALSYSNKNVLGS